MDEDRLARLARELDEMAVRDEERLAEEALLAVRRKESAFELYVMCSNFVRNVNALTERMKLDLSPPEYARDSFQESGPNIFQINAAGRVLQIAFEAADPPVSTEAFLTPYTIEGAVRWYNQESLEGQGIHEHYLFLCLEGDELVWTYFDPQTHRQGVFDEDYLTEHLEELVK